MSNKNDTKTKLRSTVRVVQKFGVSQVVVENYLLT